MGIKKNYTEYRSYQYLEPGIDYRAFDLVPQIGRVSPTTIPLTAEQEARVERLLAQSLVISLHDHPSVMPQDVSEIWAYEAQGREVTGYEGLSVSYIDALFDNMTDGTGPITSKMGWKWSDVLFDMGMRMSDVAHQDFVIRCERVDDILRAHREGKVAVAFSLESATMIENEVDRIDILYGFGVRMMGLVYSESNALGSGLKERRDGGLTHFGRQAVRRMNQLGMAIDVSHASDQTCLDAFEASRAPIFITHAGARALWDSPRLKPDDVLRACADQGGVVGIEAAPHTTVTRKHPRHNLDSFMEHYEYCVDLIGVDHVGFGPDVLFGDHVQLHHAFAAQMSIAQSRSQTANEEEVAYVEGLENPSETFPNIVRWMVKRGRSDDQIKQAIGGNALRVLRKIWGA
jgi:membrane dipeptidase